MHYTIDGNVASSVRKVLADISDTDFRGKFGLSVQEISDVHNYLDNIDVEENG